MLPAAGGVPGPGVAAGRWGLYFRRHRRVRLTWQDLDGERHEAWFAQLPARVIQHEVDHLDGLMIDEVGVKS